MVIYAPHPLLSQPSARAHGRPNSQHKNRQGMSDMFHERHSDYLSYGLRLLSELAYDGERRWPGLVALLRK